MDREVILKVSGEEMSIGYVSEFLLPRENADSMVNTVFDRIQEAIETLDLGGFETDPVVIEIY